MSDELATKDGDVMEIIRLHNSVVFFGNQTLLIAVRCGQLLAKKKQSLNHGQWLPWVKKNLPFTPRTAQRYIQVWENRQQAKLAYEVEQLSLRQFYLMMTDSKSVKPGLISADKKRMRRDIVQPIRVVKNRLKHLPWFPTHHENLVEVIEELRQAITELLDELNL